MAQELDSMRVRMRDAVRRRAQQPGRSTSASTSALSGKGAQNIYWKPVKAKVNSHVDPSFLQRAPTPQEPPNSYAEMHDYRTSFIVHTPRNDRRSAPAAASPKPLVHDEWAPAAHRPIVSGRLDYLSQPKGSLQYGRTFETHTSVMNATGGGATPRSRSQMSMASERPLSASLLGPQELLPPPPLPSGSRPLPQRSAATRRSASQPSHASVAVEIPQPRPTHRQEQRQSNSRQQGRVPPRAASAARDAPTARRPAPHPHTSQPQQPRPLPVSSSRSNPHIDAERQRQMSVVPTHARGPRHDISFEDDEYEVMEGDMDAVGASPGSRYYTPHTHDRGAHVLADRVADSNAQWLAAQEGGDELRQRATMDLGRQMLTSLHSLPPRAPPRSAHRHP